MAVSTSIFAIQVTGKFCSRCPCFLQDQQNPVFVDISRPTLNSPVGRKAAGGCLEEILKIDKSREAMRPSGGVTGWTISLSRKGYRFSKEKSEEHVLKLKQQPHATPKSNRKVFYQMFFSALLFDLLAIFGNIKTNTLCFFIAKPDGCRASECHVRSVKVERDSACSRKMRGL